MLIQILLEKNVKASKLTSIMEIYPQVLVNARVNPSKKYDFEKDEDIQKEIEKLKQEFLNEGRVIIRPSGTEPLVRVMIEGKDKKIITEHAKNLAKFIEQKLG